MGEKIEINDGVFFFIYDFHQSPEISAIFVTYDFD